ncbi:MAG: TolC family protein [Bacteroidia bacterium]
MKKTSFSALLLLLGNLCQAQVPDSTFISLDTLLYRVETNYPSILQYQYTIRSIEEKTAGAKAWMPPTFSTGLMRFPYNTMMLKEKNNPMNQAGISFSLEQMIPNPGKLNARKNYYSSLVAVENNKREWTKNELRREAKIMYYNRYVAEKQLILIKENEELLKLLISIAEEKFANNQTQLQTIYKAKARLTELNNMLQMLNGKVAESNINLNMLLVRDLNTEFKIDTLLSLKEYSLSSLGLDSTAFRSDLTLISNYINSMKLEQKVMGTGAKPDFGVRVEHMQMFGMPNQWSAMGMITIPIVPWSSKMYQTETESMGFQILAMEQEKQNMELMAKRMVAEKYAMLYYESIQYKNFLTNIIPAYENNLHANLLAYKQNTGDFFVLLDAWEMVLMKKLEANDKLFNTLKLEAEYEYEREIR